MVQQKNTNEDLGGSKEKWAYLLLGPAAPGLTLSVPENFPEEKIIDAAEVNQ